MPKFDNVKSIEDYNKSLTGSEKFSGKMSNWTIPLSGKANDGLSKYAKKDLVEPFKGTELGGVIKGFDKATGWLDKKMSGWAGKKEGEKK